MKYSVVIATYNHCEDLLKKCVDAIIAYTHLPDIELVIIANGCYDETKEYLLYLEAYFAKTNKIGNFQQVFFAEPLGYARANNIGIKLCHTDKIVLLNNDAFLLPQEKNTWLELLDVQFRNNPKCGLSGVLKTTCTLTDPVREFIIFFCVMIHKKVFDKIGYLNEAYGKGGGEDTEFCFMAEDIGGFEVCKAVEQTWSEEVMTHVGNYPIYHFGEGTVHDKTLVPDWKEVFDRNSLMVASKYGHAWYRKTLSNNYERAIYLKGDEIAYRERTRYEWAAKNLVGKKVLEVGCSIGYGVQFFPPDIDYTGIDQSGMCIDAAYVQQWGEHAKFIKADINDFPLEMYDTIIAFEVIEHLDTGFAVVEKLKKHCHNLLITVPKDEPPGLWGPHHKLHGLNEQHFPGFEFQYIDFDGALHETEPPVEGDRLNLLVGKWTDNRSLKWLETKHPDMYKEVIAEDVYRINNGGTAGRTVLDIGANIGAFSLFAAQQGAKKVIGFEPVPSTYLMALENVQQSGFKNITMVNSAVMDKPGELTINIKQENGHNSLYLEDTPKDLVGQETIQAVDFGHILSLVEGDNLYLKIDCEGAEYDILLNATQDQMDRIGDVVLEVHADLHPVHKGFDLIEDKLRGFGFHQHEKSRVFFWPINDPSNKTPLPIAMERWSRRKLPPHLGLSWLQEKHPGTFKEIISDDTYRVVNERIRGRNVLDIGANVGSFTVLTGYLGAKKVVAVEPASATYQMLQDNVRQSGLTNIVTQQNLVSDISGKFIDLSVNDSNMEENSIYRTHGEFESVETTTLGELLTQFDDDDIFLKLDCEGSEYDILLNATQAEMARVSQIVMEIHTTMHPIYKGHEVINQKLREFGFTCIFENQLYWWKPGPTGALEISSEIPLRVVFWKR